jgi:tetratricopeptide (TPR) repeat protein
MQKSCPSCGAEIFPGARFCRRCGVALRPEGDGAGDVSPQAATVPLDADASRATDGLPPTEDKTDAAKTSRVSREEMERILRAAQEADQRKLLDPNATVANLNLDSFPPGRSSGDIRQRDPEAPPAGAPATDYITPKARDTEDELTLNAPRPTRSLDVRESSGFDPTNPPLVTRETTTFDQSGTLVISTDQPNAQAAGLDQSDSSDSQAASHESAPHEPATYESAQFEAREYKLSELQPDAQPFTPRQQARGAQAVAARPRRRWPYVVAVCVVALAFTVAAAFLAFRFLRRPQLAALPTPLPTASPSAADAGEFEQKLSEAEALLAQGDLNGAIAHLREANVLDPSNTRAHRRLGELLLASGARRDAIEEFRTVTRNAPDDFTAWRQLATAQFAEGLYRDAADSYRHLISLVGDQAAEPSDLLSYADALRLSGRADDARAIYQRLATSPSEDVASTARQRLAELAQAAQTQHPEQSEQQTPRGDETASLTQPVSQPTPATTPTPAPRPTPTPMPTRPTASTPAEHYQRGVELWSSNRGAAFQEFQAAASGGSVDANYYLGLSYVEGKDIHSLNRASLIAALRYFQLAQRPGGQHVSESRRYEQELGREFDRMRRP